MANLKTSDLPGSSPFPARLPTREVRIGRLRIGGNHPILVQSMTVADTCDTDAVVAEIRTLVEAGCPLVRLTAPSIKDAENLREVRRRLRADGLEVPMVADIHFTPNAALRAAEIVEKVRINPGNYADRRKFEVFEISDAEYALELERVRERFLPLVRKLKETGAALRIGTNHGSLSDRILNRFGDTPEGMVESALEFVRFCEDEGFRDIVLSMKSSVPGVMIAAYRLLVRRMADRGTAYPLHLGVTEAGNGIEARVKSAVGIGSLLADGIGDTIRVSLTEDSRHEIPAARAILSALDWEIPRAAEGEPDRPGTVPEERIRVRDTGATPPRWTTRPISTTSSRRRTEPWKLGSLEIGGENPVRVELRIPSVLPSPGEGPETTAGTEVAPEVQIEPGMKIESELRLRLSLVGRDAAAEYLSIRAEGAEIGPAEAAFTGAKPTPAAPADDKKGAAADRARAREEIRRLETWRRLLDQPGSSPRPPLLFEWPGPGLPSEKALASLLPCLDALGLPAPRDQETAEQVRAIARACAAAEKPVRWRLDGTPATPEDRAADAADTGVAGATGTRAAGAGEQARFVSDLCHGAGLDAVGFVCEPGPHWIARTRSVAAGLANRPDLLFLEVPALGPLPALLAGGLLNDGLGDALCLVPTPQSPPGDSRPAPWPPGGVAWQEDPVDSAYRILQACRLRLTRAELIACPSCGRTQFDLQTTTARIRARTGHLRGVKIAVMGCIVNGPGEMADADFGYVGSGPGKVDLYVGRERVRKSVPQDEAEERLVELIRRSGRWIEPGG